MNDLPILKLKVFLVVFLTHLELSIEEACLLDYQMIDTEYLHPTIEIFFCNSFNIFASYPIQIKCLSGLVCPESEAATSTGGKCRPMGGEAGCSSKTNNELGT